MRTYTRDARIIKSAYVNLNVHMRARKRPTCVQVFTPARSSALCTQYTHAESEFSIFPYTPSCSAGCPPYNSYANTEKPFYFFVMHVLTSP